MTMRSVRKSAKPFAAIVLSAALMFWASGCTSTAEHAGKDSTAAHEDSTPSAQNTPGSSSNDSAPSHTRGSSKTSHSPSKSQIPKNESERDAGSKQKQNKRPHVRDEAGKTKRDANQAKLLRAMPGEQTQACATVNAGTRAMRSGQLAIAGFAEARDAVATAKKGKPVKVHLQVIPQHSASVKRVTLDVTAPDGANKRVTSTNRDTANGWTYFSVTVPITKHGNWKIEAKAGSDKGCFVASLND